MHTKNLLITGGAGFIGSNFINHYLSGHPNVRIINLDKLTYASNLKNLEGFQNHKNYVFVQGDICDRDLLELLFEKYEIDSVIHFAAESHVDNSISTPSSFIHTNILGTFELLDVARRKWMKNPFEFNNAFKNSLFYAISTDEVYGTLGPTGYFTEQTSYAPNSPYSASKASADMIARSYFHTYGMNIIVSNCSNNYGPHQHSEKLIPTIIRNALAGQDIPIYGDGGNVRDWLYVEDHCRAIELIFNKGKAGEFYNVGGACELTNNDVAGLVCKLLDKARPLKNKSYKEQIAYIKDRPGHDLRYAVSFNKINKLFGWFPLEKFESGLTKTIDWYLK